MSPSLCPFRACFLSPCPFRVGLCSSSKPYGRRHRPGEPKALKTPWQSPHFCSRRSVLFLLTHVILNQDSTSCWNGLHFFLTVQFSLLCFPSLTKEWLLEFGLVGILVILALRKPKQDYKFKAKLGYIVRSCVSNSNHPHGEQALYPKMITGQNRTGFCLEGKFGQGLWWAQFSVRKAMGLYGAENDYWQPDQRQEPYLEGWIDLGLMKVPWSHTTMVWGSIDTFKSPNVINTI